MKMNSTHTIVTMATLQKHGTDGDAQLSFFSRYADVHFFPDVTNDLAFNQIVASNVKRQSTLTGTQFDTSYISTIATRCGRASPMTGEQTNVSNISTVFLDPMASYWTPVDDYRPDLAAGLESRDICPGRMENHQPAHAEYGRALRPIVPVRRYQPVQSAHCLGVQAIPRHHHSRWIFAVFYAALSSAGDTIQLRFIRRHHCAAGITRPTRSNRSGQTISMPASIRPYSRPQYGDRSVLQASERHDRRRPVRCRPSILTQFNWAQGYSEGGEFKLSYTNGNFNAYGNFAYNISRATGPESNQYLFDADEFAYLQTHWHYTDDMQRMTGSAGASYRFMNSTTISADMIYGSGLRSGELPDFAPNDQHTTPYAVINSGISHDIRWSSDYKPPLCGSTSSTYSTGSTCCARERHRRLRAAIRRAPRLLYGPVAESLDNQA